ncbi:MAG: hypothetical protein Q4C01_06370 [Clostridia bacterium]|nr:hypothetical protein [Clostridia bacterium]
MRKKYNPPLAYIEELSVQSHINTTCGSGAGAGFGTPLQANGAACAWDIGGVTVFGPGTAMTCNLVTDEYNGICYDVPNGGFQAFSS